MRKNIPVYVLAAAIVIAGLVIAGVPGGALFTLLLLAGCPLMMFFMMRGMGGMGNDDRDHDGHSPHTHR
jgi:hypothetical protein